MPLGECLAKGMSSMASAMVEVAKMKQTNNVENQELAPILARIDQRLEEQSIANKVQADIDQALLLAIQQLTKPAN